MNFFNLWALRVVLSCEPSRPLQHSKIPRTPRLFKICPDDCCSGFQSGGPNWSKISREIDTVLPCPSFPCFFGKWQGTPPKKQGFFIPTEPLKSLEKKGKTLKKTRNSLRGQKTRNSKKTRKGRTGWNSLIGRS